MAGQHNSSSRNSAVRTSKQQQKMEVEQGQKQEHMEDTGRNELPMSALPWLVYLAW
jgi:hypothetical protein